MTAIRPSVRSLLIGTLSVSTFLAQAALPASAITVDFVSRLSGAQEVPPNSSTATGFARGRLTGDFGSNNFVFTYQLNYSGLSAGLRPAPGGAHIHAPALPGANAGVAHPLDGAGALAGTTGGTIVGDWRFDDAINPLTETRAQQLLNQLAYFNLHTTTFTGGEIRGQIVVAPEPSNVLGFAVVGGLALAAIARSSTRRPIE